MSAADTVTAADLHTRAPVATRAAWARQARWARLTRAELRTLVFVLLVRAAYFAVLHLAPVSTRESLTPDARLYLRTAQDIAAGHRPDSVDNNFPVIVGHLMRWTGMPVSGPFELLGAIGAAATVFLALWLHHLVRDGARADAGTDGRVDRAPAALPSSDDAGERGWWTRLRARWPARRLLILAIGLYPSSIVFSSTGFIRDGWIYVLALLAVTLFAAAIWSGPSVRPGLLAGTGVAGSALGFLRGYAAAALVVGLGLWLLTEPRIPVGRRLLRSRIAGLTALGVVAASWLVLRNHLDVRLRSLAAIADYRSKYLDAVSSSNMGIDFRNVSPARFVLLYAQSLLGNTIGPLPYQVRSTVLAGFFLEAAALTVCGVVLLRWCRRLGPRTRFLVMQAVAWFALIALFNDNLGTAARLRVPAWTLLLIALAAVLRDVASDPPERARSVVVPVRPRRR